MHRNCVMLPYLLWYNVPHHARAQPLSELRCATGTRIFKDESINCLMSQPDGRLLAAPAVAAGQCPTCRRVDADSRHGFEWMGHVGSFGWLRQHLFATVRLALGPLGA